MSKEECIEHARNVGWGPRAMALPNNLHQEFARDQTVESGGFRLMDFHGGSVGAFAFGAVIGWVVGVSSTFCGIKMCCPKIKFSSDRRSHPDVEAARPLQQMAMEESRRSIERDRAANDKERDALAREKLELANAKVAFAKEKADAVVAGDADAARHRKLCDDLRAKIADLEREKAIRDFKNVTNDYMVKMAQSGHTADAIAYRKKRSQSRARSDGWATSATSATDSDASVAHSMASAPASRVVGPCSRKTRSQRQSRPITRTITRSLPTSGIPAGMEPDVIDPALEPGTIYCATGLTPERQGGDA